MAYSFDFIFGSASHEGRKARFAGNPANVIEGVAYGHNGVIVLVETAHQKYEELDADNAAHGVTLAESWVDNKRAICASVWEVADNGALRKRIALVEETVEFLTP